MPSSSPGAALETATIVSGNYKERRRILVLKTILETLGLESDRVWLRWVAASEVPKFAATMNEVTAEVKKPGPQPHRPLVVGVIRGNDSDEGG